MKINQTQTQPVQPVQQVQPVQGTEKYPSWVEDAIKDTAVDLSKDVNYNSKDALALKKIVFAIFSGQDVKVSTELKETFIVCTFKNENGEKIASYTLPKPKLNK